MSPPPLTVPQGLHWFQPRTKPVYRELRDLDDRVIGTFRFLPKPAVTWGFTDRQRARAEVGSSHWDLSIVRKGMSGAFGFSATALIDDGKTGIIRGVFRERDRLAGQRPATALLSTAGAPASLPRTSLWVSGIVLERTPGGMRPIAGASAELAADDSDAFVMSATMTDGSGRYLLCTAPPGVGTDQIASVRVRKERYRPAARSIIIGGPPMADIELVGN